MRNSSFIFKSSSIYFILSAFMLNSFLGCKEENSRSNKKDSIIHKVKEVETDQNKLFLTYVDSVSKLPEAKFTEAGIRSLNKRFFNKLPVVMYDPTKEDNGQSIIIQYHKDKEEYLKMGSEIIILIPETITDSLVVADFTDYFGSIKNEKPLIGVTAQPLPVFIQVSSNRAIKLTFKNNEDKNQAGVTAVEVLNYR
ncbi:hypothetical protein [Chryseobacterium sp. FH1]|uniref:hypothetical protein n=1 Tax=Chryseobacterium sp. FH1 TaxID=1233951 RepID=UPI000A5DC898|nr:hypothetical protein [Chryseobacterium sp. FH1]